MKKGQMEMIGLVIIVILLIIGALFYVRFGVLGQTNKKEESTVKVTQAYNLMNALININICQDKPLKDALAQCKEEPTKLFCTNQDACTFAKKQIQLIVDPLLHTTVGLDYTFQAKTGEDVYLTFGKCETGTNSPPLRFTSNGKQYQAYFRLCPLQTTD